MNGRTPHLRIAIAIQCVLAAGVACERPPSPDPGAEPKGNADSKSTHTPMPTKRPRAKGCVADKLGTLTDYGGQSPECKDVASVRCSQACAGRDARACYDLAMATEHDEAGDAEAEKMFRRACEMGMAIGCTNYAAVLWGRGENLGCARRIFEKACAANETWGCGMLGRMLITDEASGKAELARGREILERGCDSLGGFSCRALAMELEGGKLGPYKPARIRKLLARACTTGDSDGCRRSKSASATTHKTADQD
jgi:TPR repeat protein